MEDIFNIGKEIIKKYPLEIFLIFASVCSAITSYYLFYNVSPPTKDAVVSLRVSSTSNNIQSIYVDISGAVRHPGLYQMSEGDRIQEVIKKAGGYTDEADTGYISHALNLAQRLKDQDKIYIPSKEETASGSYLISSAPTENSAADSLISLNESEENEIESLPNVGKVTAQKIINSRPYKALEELYTKGVISKNLFDKIKDSLRL